MSKSMGLIVAMVLGLGVLPALASAGQPCPRVRVYYEDANGHITCAPEVRGYMSEAEWAEFTGVGREERNRDEAQSALDGLFLSAPVRAGREQRGLFARRNEARYALTLGRFARASGYTATARGAGYLGELGVRLGAVEPLAVYRRFDPAGSDAVYRLDFGVRVRFDAARLTLVGGARGVLLGLESSF